MNINIYKNTSDPRKVYKNLTLLRENVSIQITDDCTIENPVLITKLDNMIPSANYVYIPQFGRYYFANNEIIKGNLCKISCQVDVLYSFFSNCTSSPIIAKRSSSHPDYRIEDNRVLKLPEPEILIKDVNCEFTLSNQNNYVLTISGK